MKSNKHKEKREEIEMKKLGYIKGGINEYIQYILKEDNVVIDINNEAHTICKTEGYNCSIPFTFQELRILKSRFS